MKNVPIMLRAFANIGEQSRLAFNIPFLMSRGAADLSELGASVHLGAAASVCCAAPQAPAGCTALNVG